MLYQTHVKIHLDNIRDNLLAIRERVGGPDVKILPALKANAYGHGSVEVARVAEDCGMDWIGGVATVPEGMAIRQAGGVRLPILKLSPAFPEEMEAAIENDVTLSVIDAEYIQILQETAKRMGKKINVHLKVDTGMGGRIGVRPETAPERALFIEKNCPNLHLQGIFTHMPVADMSDLDPPFLYTEDQIQHFKNVVETVNQAIGREIELPPLR